MSDAGWGIVFVLGLGLLIAAVLGLVVWQAFKVWQTRITAGVVVAQDGTYRKLAEEATAAQQAIAGELAEVRARVVAIEHLLREVG